MKENAYVSKDIKLHSQQANKEICTENEKIVASYSNCADVMLKYQISACWFCVVKKREGGKKGRKLYSI